MRRSRRPTRRCWDNKGLPTPFRRMQACTCADPRTGEPRERGNSRQVSCAAGQLRSVDSKVNMFRYIQLYADAHIYIYMTCSPKRLHDANWSKHLTSPPPRASARTTLPGRLSSSRLPPRPHRRLPAPPPNHTRRSPVSGPVTLPAAARPSSPLALHPPTPARCLSSRGDSPASRPQPRVSPSLRDTRRRCHAHC